ncbi:hypothetical protein C8F01DRAFT_1163896 [Mycena amicta]|nr:hypothetical protein C8F01DRAFT_1163896 [Mycena amicta]
MRLAPTLLLPALAGAVVQASHLVPSRPLQRGLLDDLLNICATIPDLDINLLGIDIDLNLCLCLQGLDIYLATHDDVNLQNQQIADVNAKINGLGVGYSRPPPNAMRVCDGSSGFTCVDGFVPCNGACVAANTCPGPSSLPRAVKRDTKITTLHHARAHCGSRDAAVCGVANPKHEYDFECVDIRSDFDSCGGCVIQHPFPSLESKSARGQECAAIRNARSVSCQNSKCVVQKCRRGYKINANGNGCELKQGKAPRGLLDSVLGSAPTSTTSPSNDINILGLLTIQLAIKLGSGNGPVCHDGLIGTVNQLLNPLLGGKDLIGGDAAVINLGGLPSGLDVDKLVGSGGSPLAGLVDGLVDLLNSLLDGLLGSCGAPLLNDVKAILDQLVGGLQSCGCGPAVAQAIPGLIANASSAATASPPGLPPAPPLPSTPAPSNDIDILGLLTIQLAIKLGSGNGPVCHDGLIGTVNQLLNPLLGGKDLIGGDAAVINLGNGLGATSGGLPLVGSLVEGPVTDLVGGLIGGLRRRDSLNGLLDGLLGSCGAPLLDDVEAILNQLLGGMKDCGCGPAVAQAIPGLIANATSAAKRAHVVPSRRGHSGL